MEHGFKANFYNKKEEIETGLQDYEEDNGFLASSEQKKHIEAISRQEGVECDKEPTVVAMNIGKALQNECIPEGSYSDLKSFHEAMLQKVEEYNSALSGEDKWRSIKPWSYDEITNSLSHTTGSGRMKITLSDNTFDAGLYSPAHADGDVPFYSVTLQNGKLYSTLINPDVLELGDRLNRISHVYKYFVEQFGLEELLDASTDRVTKKYTIDLIKSSLDADIEEMELGRNSDEFDTIGNITKRLENYDEADLSRESLSKILEGHENTLLKLKRAREQIEKYEKEINWK